MLLVAMHDCETPSKNTCLMRGAAQPGVYQPTQFSSMFHRVHTTLQFIVYVAYMLVEQASASAAEQNELCSSHWMAELSGRMAELNLAPASTWSMV